MCFYYIRLLALRYLGGLNMLHLTTFRGGNIVQTNEKSPMWGPLKFRFGNNTFGLKRNEDRIAA